MYTSKLKYALPAALLLGCLGTFALGQFRPSSDKIPALKLPSSSPPSFSPAPVVPPASAPNSGAPERPAALLAEESKPEKVEAARPASGGRRREATIKVPVGTFVKDMDVGGYGSGRLTWTFEEDKILGVIEANVMGVEVELRTEAEYSLSSTGTIYGIVTHVEWTHLKIGGGAIGMLGEIGEYAKMVKLAEPLLIEVMTDLPFSYQFRVSGNKLTILNYRTLLAGPNPLGKLGGVIGGGDSGLAILSYFQMISVAIEGTYTASDPESRDKSKLRPIIKKSPDKK